MSFASLPVINLQSNPDDIRQSLLLACSTTGFFYLSNHGLDSFQHRMFNLSKEFFHLPLNEKLAYSINTTSYQGYLRIGHENLDSTNSQLIDEKEAFKLGQSELKKKDQLPEIFSRDENFKLIEEFFRKCYDICINLFEYLAETLQITRDYFTSRHKWDKEPGATLKLLHYPPINKTKQDTNAVRAVRSFMVKKYFPYKVFLI